MPFKLQPHPDNRNGFRYADHTDINLYFGFAPGVKVPREFTAEMQIPLMNDVLSTPVRYGPGAPMRMGRFGRLIKSSKHRVHAKCLDCTAWVPAGRVHQHKCKVSI